jgi:hypothetical protein
MAAWLHHCITALLHRCIDAHSMLHACSIETPAKPAKARCWRSGEARGGERAARKIPTSTRPNLEQLSVLNAQSVLCWDRD